MATNGRCLRHRPKRSGRCLNYGNCTNASGRGQTRKVCPKGLSVKTMLGDRAITIGAKEQFAWSPEACKFTNGFIVCCTRRCAPHVVAQWQVPRCEVDCPREPARDHVSTRIRRRDRFEKLEIAVNPSSRERAVREQRATGRAITKYVGVKLVV